MSSVGNGNRSNIAFALLLGLLVYVLWVLRHTLLLVYISIVFAVILTPAVHRIQKLRVGHWHPGRGMAILILIGCVLAFIAVAAVFILPSIIQDAQSFAQDLPAQVQQLSDDVSKLPFADRVARRLSPGTIEKHLGDVLKRTFSAFTAVAGGLTDALLVGLITAYFILDGPRTLRWALSLLPISGRQRLQTSLEKAAHRAQRWLTAQLLLMLILGGSSAVVFGFLHVRYFYALALFAGASNFIPVVGPIATVIVAGLIAALDSWWKLFGVVLFYLIYQQVENAFLTPRIMQSAVGLPGVAVIVALAVGGALAGVLGALVAVPSAAMLSTLISEYAVHESEGKQ